MSIPIFKKQFEEDEIWRNQRKQTLIEEGFSENEATEKTWDEYLELVEERDGVERLVRRLV